MEDVMNSGPRLAIGSTGPDVRRVQILLVMIKLLNFSAIDGNFGPKTQDAVKSFQEGNNLTRVGGAGRVTGTACQGTRTRRRESAGQTVPSYPHCKRG